MTEYPKRKCILNVWVASRTSILQHLCLTCSLKDIGWPWAVSATVTSGQAPLLWQTMLQQFLVAILTEQDHCPVGKYTCSAPQVLFLCVDRRMFGCIAQGGGVRSIPILSLSSSLWNVSFNILLKKLSLEIDLERMEWSLHKGKGRWCSFSNVGDTPAIAPPKDPLASIPPQYERLAVGQGCYCWVFPLVVDASALVAQHQDLSDLRAFETNYWANGAQRWQCFWVTTLSSIKSLPPYSTYKFHYSSFFYTLLPDWFSQW